jgi:hypothetical protein
MSEEKQANITIEIAPDGLHIRCEYTGAISTIPAAVERLRAAGILDLVKPATHTAPLGAARKAAERTTPTYNGAGEPCCPKHNRALKEGQYGLYCPAKDESTERGYCALKFKD